MFSNICAVLVTLLLGISWSYSKPPQSEDPTVKRAIPAIYPPLAAVAKESGTVVVEVKVNPNGIVSEATAVGGHKLFKSSAERSARQWVFNSTGYQRSRVARVTFSFKFMKKPGSPEDLLPAFMPPYGVEIIGP